MRNFFMFKLSLAAALFSVFFLVADQTAAQKSQPGLQPGYKQKGKASFYSNSLHGRKTASGEPYSMFAMTAAHPSFQFGSIVKVTNLKNGKWVTLRINDRGPFTKKRIIDVSKAAAIKLDFIKDGLAEVEVELVRVGEKETEPSATPPVAESDGKPSGNTTADKPTSTTPTVAQQTPAKPAEKTTETAKSTVRTKKRLSIEPEKAVSIAKTLMGMSAEKVAKRFGPVNTYTIDGRSRSPRGFGVQIGSYTDPIKAVEVVAEGYNLGMNELYIQSGWQNGVPAYRVILGAVAKEEEARELVNVAVSKGFSGAFVRKHF